MADDACSRSVVAALVVQAQGAGARVALRCGARTATFAELHAIARRICAALQARGIGPGDRVALAAGDSIEFVAAVYAIWGAGASVVSINPRQSVDDTAYQLSDSTPALALAGSEELVGTLTAAGSVATVTLVEAASSDPEAELRVGGADETATIFYTSGTTGRPKGATHTHRALLAQIAAESELYGLGADDRFVSVLPLCLLSPLVGGPLTSVTIGAACRIIERFDAAEICRRIAEDGATFGIVVPVFFYDAVRLARAGDPIDLSSMRVVHFGGTPIAPELRAEAERILGIVTAQAYGATECPNMVAGEGPAPDRSVDSTGPALPFCRIAIEDAEGNTLPAGREGSVVIYPNPGARVPFVPMSGYWNRPEDSAAALRGGGLRLGDVGRLDVAGNLSIVGREKDVIFRGGMNVYPVELERVLCADPRVDEAAVVAQAHPRLDEVPAAYVRLAGGGARDPDVDSSREPVEVADLLAAANARLSRYKAIEELVVVDGFPRNAMGKITKRELAAFLAAEPGHILARASRQAPAERRSG